MPATMISAYERDKRQPTLATLLRLLEAAGFELRMHLEPLDDHDAILRELEALRTPQERARRDRQTEIWREAAPVVEVAVADLADVIRPKEASGRPKDLRALPILYRHLAARRAAETQGSGGPSDQELGQ